MSQLYWSPYILLKLYQSEQYSTFKHLINLLLLCFMKCLKTFSYVNMKYFNFISVLNNNANTKIIGTYNA